MQKPKVSIIIPTLNEEKYLANCLRSIKRQNFAEPFEVIIADGGSTDRTAQIARLHGAKVVRERHGTPSGGRHTAARVAKGEILVFTNADVEVCDGWLESICRPFKDKNVSGAVGSILPLDGNFIENAFFIFLPPITFALNELGIPYVYGENMACLKSAYKKCGGFKPHLVTGEEAELAVRLKKVGKLVFVQEAKVKLSMRRVRKWGYLKYLLFHTTNFIRTHFFAGHHKNYEPIR
ncbi:MAG: glycosyltransferase [Candidatus Micrarchaeota archaeon]|nr:glycosyltransferase [Candidatus Micrarchaeota archaeon]